MIKAPTTVKVGPFVYKIVFVGGLEDDEGQVLWGNCQPANLTINISKQIDPAMQKTILVHEILHAIYHLSGLPDPVSEEQMVTTLSPLLLLVMQENPKLIGYLHGK